VKIDVGEGKRVEISTSRENKGILTEKNARVEDREPEEVTKEVHSLS